jgi:hypothetical protein
VAVNLSNNRAAVAVGSTARTSQNMRQFPSQGKGVLVLHVEGDLLWFGSGSRPSAPNLGHPGQTQEDEDDAAQSISQEEYSKEDARQIEESHSAEERSNTTDGLEEKVEDLTVKFDLSYFSSRKVINLNSGD